MNNKELLKMLKIKKLTKEKLGLIFNDIFKKNTNEKYPDMLKIGIVKNYYREHYYNVGLIKDKTELGNTFTIEELKEEIKYNTKLSCLINPSFYCIGGKSLGVSFRAYALKYELPFAKVDLNQLFIIKET